MKIVFEKLRFKNFLSTGNNFLELELNTHSYTLILGKNGEGKSTFIDALTFALYGKAFRNINKPSLVNSINNSNCCVEVEFGIGSKKYKVIRGIKPTRFEIYCDDVLIDQDSKTLDYQSFLENEILHLNFKVFKQIIILGSKSFIPFMKLTALDRRIVSEDIFDIKIYSSMMKTTKLKLAMCEEELKEIYRDISSINEKIDLQKSNIESYARKTNNQIEANEKNIQNYLSLIEIRKETLSVLEKNLSNLLKDDVERKRVSVRKKLDSLNTYHAQISQNLVRIDEELLFYDKNDNCPLCRQQLDVEFKEFKLSSVKEKKNKMETGLQEIIKSISSFSETVFEYETILSKIRECRQNIELVQNDITNFRKFIQKIEDDNNNVRNNVMNEMDENQNLQEFEKTLSDLELKKNNVLKTRKHLELISVMLKDNGIKTNVIRKYIPIINTLINKYLSFMDFHVNFTLKENFEEVILSRHRDEFAYENFSEGEKIRIDIAILFALRGIAKIKNSIDTNILIMDEIIDASLDDTGVEDFFKLISSISDVNMFIISPNGDVFRDKFQNVIRFKKVNNFSEVEYE